MRVHIPCVSEVHAWDLDPPELRQGDIVHHGGRDPVEGTRGKSQGSSADMVMFHEGSLFREGRVGPQVMQVMKLGVVLQVPGHDPGRHHQLPRGRPVTLRSRRHPVLAHVWFDPQQGAC